VILDENILGNSFTPERALLVETARKFSIEKVLPAANSLDAVQGDIPAQLLREMAEMGFFGLLVPAEFGGAGLGAIEYVLVTEELARSWMSVASIIARTNGLVELLSEEQRGKYLGRMAQGDFIGAVAISEADAGSDVASLSCRAARAGNGWKISGSKSWCTFADGADFLIVLARTEPVTDWSRRSRGISAFLIEKNRGEFPPGVSGTAVRKIGYFGWKTWDLAFDDVFVSDENLIGESGQAFALLMNTLQLARVHTAARSVGLARGALEDSIRYARERNQFGQAISEFQATRFKIADMTTDVAAARQLMYLSAGQIDQGTGTIEGASMAKLFASEMSERVTSEAMQIHGGAGYTTDHAVERYWRDARLTRIFEGTSEIQRKLISDRIFGYK
jgi:alkylation response protein AidB-like acyl-CoA dehydrogenase